MADIYLDEQLNIVIEEDLKLIDEARAARQRLFLFLNFVKKGDLFWAKEYGFDRIGFMKLCKLKNRQMIKNYLIQSIMNIKLIVTHIEVEFLESKILIEVHLPGQFPVSIDIDE